MNTSPVLHMMTAEATTIAIAALTITTQAENTSNFKLVSNCIISGMRMGKNSKYGDVFPVLLLLLPLSVLLLSCVLLVVLVRESVSRTVVWSAKGWRWARVRDWLAGCLAGSDRFAGTGLFCVHLLGLAWLLPGCRSLRLMLLPLLCPLLL